MHTYFASLLNEDPSQQVNFFRIISEVEKHLIIARSTPRVYLKKKDRIIDHMESILKELEKANA
jgi:hypothetical protein